MRCRRWGCGHALFFGKDPRRDDSNSPPPHSAAAIEHDTAVVPRGAYIVTPQHHITENRLFTGLDAAELTVGGGSATNAPADTAWAAALLHFREPEGAKRKGALGRAAAVGVGAQCSGARAATCGYCAGCGRMDSCVGGESEAWGWQST